MNVKHEPYKETSSCGCGCLTILIIVLTLALLILISCTDTRHMVKHYDKMEAGRAVDTVYQAAGQIYEIEK